MRIAYLVNEYPATSIGFIRREIHAVEAHGVEVLRFSLRPVRQKLVTEADLAEQAKTRCVLAAGVLRHALAIAWSALRRPRATSDALVTAIGLGWRSDRGLLRHLAYFGEACVLEPWLRRAGITHLHAHFGTNPAAVALLCRKLGGPPYSFTVHGPEEFDRPEFLGLREKVKGAAFVVAISSYGRAQLCRWARYEDWEKIRIVRCGLGPDLLRAPITPTPAVPRFVCVARLSEQKGHLLLLDAAAQLAAEGREFEIVLAGDGPFRELITDRIKSLGIERHVRIAGWMSATQVRESMLGARALVLPSFAEGLPVVLMEALALHRAVVTTAIAGVPELVESGKTGWLVPAGSSEALAQALREVLESEPAALDAMGAAGAALVARHHDASAEAKKLILFIEQAGGEGAVAPVGEQQAGGAV